MHIKRHHLCYFILTLILIIAGFSSPKVQASFFYHQAFNYYSSSDNAENSSSSTMRNIFLLGASFGRNDKIIFGQHIMSWNKSEKANENSNESQLSLLELGPRLHLFFDDSKNFSLSFAYNPYVKGTRTLSTVGATEEEVSGTSLYASLSYQLKISKKFYLGASLNYHTITLDKSIQDNEKSDIAHSYTYIYPVIDLSIRFR